MKRSIEGSIYQAKDKKSWFARLRYTDKEGRPREKKRVCATYALAKNTLKQLRAEIETEKSDRKTYRQLDEFYRKKYLHEAKFIDGKKISGYRQDMYGLKQWLDFALEYFGDRYLDSITYHDLQSYYEQVVAHPTKFVDRRSFATINHFMKMLRRVLNVAVEQEWLLINPFKKGSPLIRQTFETDRTRVLSSTEERQLLDACTGKRKHLKPLVVFAIETGCRKNEILSLKWQNVNLDGRYAQVESHTTKTLRGRLVPISTRLSMVLRDLWTRSPQKQNLPIFACGDFKKSFVSACADAKLVDVTFHDLRHTAITRMLEKNISPALVMKISGHTQSKTFMRYVNQSESSIFDVAVKLDIAA